MGASTKDAATVPAASPENQSSKDNSAGSPSLPPVLGRLASGTFWVALRAPLHTLFGFLTIPMIKNSIGEDMTGAYYFAWSFGFFQVLLELGMSSALTRRVSEAWTRGDRDGVDRTVACGLAFYGLMSLAQVAALLAICYGTLRFTDYQGAEIDLIVKLLWLQVLTAPCYGASMIAASVLQAARRYDVFPRCDFLVVILRFGILTFGLWQGWDFFLIVLTMTATQIGFGLLPPYWVMIHKVGYVPKLGLARFSELSVLMKASFFVFLLQLSVILAEKVDTIVINYALTDPGKATTTYLAVSKPFTNIRQLVMMVTGLLVPAVASLAVAGNHRELDQVKYDASRLLIALFAPITVLACLYAAPFLSLWMGPEYHDDAGLMRLFLVATLPLMVTVLIQMAIGMGDIKWIASVALIGSLINLPLSYGLTIWLQNVSGVIWGTVLTTLFSNLWLPALHLKRTLEVRLGEFAIRSLAAPLCGCFAAAVVCVLMQMVWSVEPVGSSRGTRAFLLIAHLTIGCLAFLAGYLIVPVGRRDGFRLLGLMKWTSSNNQSVPVNVSPTD